MEIISSHRSLMAVMTPVTACPLNSLAGRKIYTLPHEILPRAVRMFLTHESIHKRSTEGSSSDLGPLRPEPRTRVISRLHRSLRTSGKSRAGTSLNQGDPRPEFSVPLGGGRGTGIGREEVVHGDLSFEIVVVGDWQLQHRQRQPQAQQRSNHHRRNRGAERRVLGGATEAAKIEERPALSFENDEASLAQKPRSCVFVHEAPLCIDEEVDHERKGLLDHRDADHRSLSQEHLSLGESLFQGDDRAWYGSESPGRNETPSADGILARGEALVQSVVLCQDALTEPDDGANREEDRMAED
ncbi:hypothetical protein ACJ41O_010176 [Fusarium nematophilum]